MKQTELNEDQPVMRMDINRILRGADREIRALLRRAHDQGFVIKRTNSKHYSISSPPGQRPRVTVFAPGTPSDSRGLHRVNAKLRRIGVDIPH